MARKVNEYVQGELVRLSAQVRRRGVNLDPDEATFTLWTPAQVTGNLAGTDFSYSGGAGPVVREALGLFALSQPANLLGLWEYAFRSTGVITADKWKFKVVEFRS